MRRVIDTIRRSAMIMTIVGMAAAGLGQTAGATPTTALSETTSSRVQSAELVPTTVDVGVTIVDPQTWQWKGSGSYSNGNGSYKKFCVQIRQQRPTHHETLSSRCVDTPAGSQGEFSAPPVACYNKLGWKIYTRAIALNSAGEIVGNGKAESNRIPHTC